MTRGNITTFNIIGTIVSIGDPIPFGDNQKRRTVIREDAESHPLECTFFDNWADMFNDINDNRESLGHVVIILQLAKVKYWYEKSQVGNALFGMKIYINSDLPEIVAFKERYKNKDGFDESSCKINHYSPEKTVVMTESFFEQACKKTVGAIRDSDAVNTTLVVYAKIHKIHKEHGWQYLACRRCNTAVKEQATKAGARPSASKKPTYKCEAHGLQVPVPKYKVIVRVIDDTRSASLVQFDKMVHNLVYWRNATSMKVLQKKNSHNDIIMTGDNQPPKQPIDKAYSIASIKACIPSPLDLEKLNYNSWSNLFKCFCRTYDVVHHLEPPASTSTAPPDPFHATNDSLVVMWMYSTISPKLVEMVIDDTTMAHEVWKKLKELFHDNKASRVIQLDNEIRNMAIGTSTVNDYFQDIKSKADRLANLGSPVTDSSLVTYAINGLRAKFPEIARIIRHRETLPTFDQVRSMVLLEESDMAQLSNTLSSTHLSSNSPTVLLATSTNSSKNSTMNTSGIDQCRNFQRGTCTYGSRCKFVHGSHDFRPRINSSGSNSNPKPNGSTSSRGSQSASTSNRGTSVQSKTDQPLVTPYTQIHNFGMAGFSCVNPYMFYQSPVGLGPLQQYSQPNLPSAQFSSLPVQVQQAQAQLQPAQHSQQAHMASTMPTTQQAQYSFQPNFGSPVNIPGSATLYPGSFAYTVPGSIPSQATVLPQVSW
ncbi:hypothetical protein CTI12_AA349500 [Artemisia annua]|uniref:C3H1-type domain-containing protein n=1 Tax=Artemisia annua TaxID=35608 RepID=A0A2U1MQ93_ARTAN|nr:hypothetical protein CTI12_AA349500 [Artemisia annua]